MSAGSAAAVERVVAEGGDADDILRATVSALAEQAGVAWAGIAFLDGGVFGLGPAAGLADESRRTRTQILFQGTVVGELWIDGEHEQAELGRIAVLVAPYVLIGWDTDGEVWDP